MTNVGHDADLAIFSDGCRLLEQGPSDHCASKYLATRFNTYTALMFDHHQRAVVVA
ncbi:hypothetical protein D9M71_748000 [compost metagenome]